jgi:hypothetical protein
MDWQDLSEKKINLYVMIRILYLITCVFLLNNQTKSQHWEWVKQYSLNEYSTSGISIGIDKNSNIYGTGFSLDDGSWLFTKLDFAGKKIFDKNIPVGVSVTDTEGNTYGIGINGKRLLKYDSEGHLKWTRDLENGVLETITLHSLGGVVITGRNQLGNIPNLNCFSPSYNSKYFISYLDFNGNCIWAKESDKIISTYFKDEILYTIVDKDGYNNEYRGIIKIYNKEGVLLSTISSNVNNANKLYVDGQQHLYFYAELEEMPVFNGITYSNYDLKNTSFILCKINKEGQLIQIKKFFSPFFRNSIEKIACDSFSNIYLCGSFNKKLMIDNNIFESQYTEAYVIKMNEDGIIQWINETSSHGSAIPKDMVINKKNEIFIIGSLSGKVSFQNLELNSSTFHPYSDLFIAKLSENAPPPLKASPSLKDEGNFNIFPNPNKGSFNLFYQNNYSGILKIKLRNINGSLVYEFRDNMNDYYQKQLQIPETASGIYFVELQTEKERLVKKICITK